MKIVVHSFVRGRSLCVPTHLGEGVCGGASRGNAAFTRGGLPHRSGFEREIAAKTIPESIVHAMNSGEKI
jgi:hypothetical protein